ncbi:MAG: DsbA family protein [Acidimicrobiales bacterium]|nr:DsbA family protein [Acidimicrobiales bacterium]
MTEIEVFADIVCPFAHVGLQRFVARRHELQRDDVRLVLRAWPLEVVNGSPMDPEAVAHKVADLRAQIAPDLFAHFDAAAFPATSIPALALTHAAYRGGTDVGEAVGLALRAALFDEGRDVSTPEVLDDIAARFGVGPVTEADRASVEADRLDGVSRGVIGSPYFYTPDGAGHFCPSLHIEKVQDHLAVEFDVDRFDAVIAATLA